MSELEDFLRDHHSPIVSQLNAEIERLKTQIERLKNVIRTKEALELAACAEADELRALLRCAAERDEILCLRRLAASESAAKEKAWQRINDLERKLNIPLALLDNSETELSEVDELLSQSQKVSSRYFAEIRQLKAERDRHQAYEDRATKAMLAAQAERDRYKFALECSNPLVCPNDNHTLGCKCDCMTCVNRQRGQDGIAIASETVCGGRLEKL